MFLRIGILYDLKRIDRNFDKILKKLELPMFDSESRKVVLNLYQNVKCLDFL